jgi:biotin synthase-like enzyme
MMFYYKKLKKAGITAYNHNLDTSENFYPKIITHENIKIE